jgi:hypothetical protein
MRLLDGECNTLNSVNQLVEMGPPFQRETVGPVTQRGSPSEGTGRPLAFPLYPTVTVPRLG